ncbi:hypothetical protein ZWY2020_000958 [Hordeum vulgare]|nr:hypothetical protein ZWY2020_000958 [Hordeum vulgare]
MSVPSDRSRPREDGCASTRVRSYSPPHGGTAAERLAEDMLVEILSRVPARSVCRFKCVSKHWLSLIDHPDHRKKLPQTLAGFFYTRSDNGQLPLETEVRFVSVSGKRGPPVDTSFAFLPSHRRVDLLDCCNGLLLCRWYAVSAPDDEFRYIVCNPAREEWVELPDTSHADNVRRQALHLGFDPVVSPHFYVFAFLEDAHFNFYLAGVEVYSSETRRWVYKEIGWSKRIKLAARQSDAVFLNGCLHFYASGKISPFYIVRNAAVSTIAQSPSALFVHILLSFPRRAAMAAEGLADDLLVEILSRVPARSLCRFKCVSRIGSASSNTLSTARSSVKPQPASSALGAAMGVASGNTSPLRQCLGEKLPTHRHLFCLPAQPPTLGSTGLLQRPPPLSLVRRFHSW